MAEFLRIRDAGGPEGEDRHPHPGQSVSRPDDSNRYCAYNVNHGRFICTEVEAADFSPILIESRMATLTPGSETAFWLTPYRGLPPTSFRFPIDLVTLNRSHVVLEAIESYPLSRGSESGPPAASALALPPNTIASIGISPGDQLILATPEEMKTHLKRLESQKPVSPVIPISGSQESNRQEEDGADDSGVNAASERLLWENRQPENAPTEKVEYLELPEASPSAEPDRAALAEQLGWNNPNPGPKPKKSWWQAWKKPEAPEDPRIALRASLPGLVAYFFTGGLPAAHGIRNISATGVYVLTDERWYLGTVVRLTLTDKREQTSERSITLNAKVVRWGNDGVGLHFILRGKKDPPPAENDIAGGTTREDVQQFLDRYRGEHPAP